jgi:hypothetical protein
VVPSGPTIRDSFANAAFYYGLTHGLTLRHDNTAACLPFTEAKNNFYDCARYGLDATVTWLGGSKVPVSELILGELLEVAAEGLQDLGIEAGSAGDWLDIIRARAQTRQNGAAWQRGWVARHGHDMYAMVDQYYDHQQSEQPVHTWAL